MKRRDRPVSRDWIGRVLGLTEGHDGRTSGVRRVMKVLRRVVGEDDVQRGW